MTGFIKKLLISASLAASASTIFSAPANAGSITNVTIGGSAANDFFVYDANDTSTFQVNSTLANVRKVLEGNATNPTGNVELRAGSEQPNFDFTKNTSLSGIIGGKNITLSSLTVFDWFGTNSGINTNYGANTLATKWFNEFLHNAGGGNYVGTALGRLAFNIFAAAQGFERSSDPNISYVNQDDTTGEIKIGLAGHYDLKAVYLQNPQLSFLTNFIEDGFQGSEVVKVTYDGAINYLYSFQATKSGLKDFGDGSSHSGNYQVKIVPIAPPQQSVPEPTPMLGLMVVGGILVAKRRIIKQA